jgi:hypothetical protein
MYPLVCSVLVIFHRLDFGLTYGPEHVYKLVMKDLDQTRKQRQINSFTLRGLLGDDNPWKKFWDTHVEELTINDVLATVCSLLQVG